MTSGPLSTGDLARLETGFINASGPSVRLESDAAGTPCVDVARGRWLETARHARDALGLDFLDWLSAVDQPDGDPAGVDVVLHVASTAAMAGGPGLRRMLLRTRVPDSDPALPSLTALWPGVAWHERETHEMFGVAFLGFDDRSGLGLRPLLLPDGFEGTPLRKSFVLAARAVKAWPGAKEPGESDTHAAPSRRKTLPAGVPDPATWGPRRPSAEPPAEKPAETPAEESAEPVEAGDA
jgi:NADH-quinone oxidoreductase subunit C